MLEAANLAGDTSPGEAVFARAENHCRDADRAMAITLNDVEVLKNLPLFEGLPSKVVMNLLGNSVVRNYPRRTTLFVQGDKADRFFVVFSGWVKLYRQAADGTETVIQVFGPGESFAEAAMFGDGHYPVGAEIAGDARLLEVLNLPFRQQLIADPDLLFRMMATLSTRLKGFVHRTEQLTTRTSEQRVAAFLLQFCLSHDGNPVTLKLPYNKHLVAGRLGMKPETFSRALARLRQHGVSVEGSEIHIEDPSAIAQYAAEEED